MRAVLTKDRKTQTFRALWLLEAGSNATKNTLLHCNHLLLIVYLEAFLPRDRMFWQYSFLLFVLYFFRVLNWYITMS